MDFLSDTILAKRIFSAWATAASFVRCHCLPSPCAELNQPPHVTMLGIDSDHSASTSLIPEVSAYFVMYAFILDYHVLPNKPPEPTGIGCFFLFALDFIGLDATHCRWLSFFR